MLFSLLPYNDGSDMAFRDGTPHRSLHAKVENFWQRVSDGLAVNQLWSQLEKDARSSYRLYSAGLDNLEVEPSRGRRFLRTAKALFWAILEKLTPARRFCQKSPTIRAIWKR